MPGPSPSQAPARLGRHLVRQHQGWQVGSGRAPHCGRADPPARLGRFDSTQTDDRRLWPAALPDVQMARHGRPGPRVPQGRARLHDRLLLRRPAALVRDVSTPQLRQGSFVPAAAGACHEERHGALTLLDDANVHCRVGCRSAACARPNRHTRCPARRQVLDRGPVLHQLRALHLVLSRARQRRQRGHADRQRLPRALQVRPTPPPGGRPAPGPPALGLGTVRAVHRRCCRRLLARPPARPPTRSPVAPRPWPLHRVSQA
jgi:hypothetical protein